MMQILLVTRDPALKAFLGSLLPEGCKVEERAVALQALELLESTRPDLIVADFNLSGIDGLSFLKMAQHRFPTLPPIVFVAPLQLDDSSKSRLAELGITSFLRRPFEAEKARSLLAPLFPAQGSPAMSPLECLAMAYAEAAPRKLYFRGGGYELALFTADGKLWALRHPLFDERYLRSLAPSDLAWPEADSDYLKLMAQMEARAGSISATAGLKRQVVLSLLASLAPEAGLRVVADAVQLPPVLIPLEIPVLIMALLERLPDGALADLRKPGFKIKLSPRGVPKDLPFQPHHGYLLSQCAQPITVEDLLKTGILPEGQILADLYLFLLLGVLETEPKVKGCFRLKGLSGLLEEESLRLKHQTDAIQNLVAQFQTPGANPYQILGVPEEAGYRRILDAYELMQERLSQNRLHPEVFRGHQKDILFLKAKLQEAFMLIQSSMLQDRSQGAPPPGQVPREAVAEDDASGVQEITEAQKKEAEKMLKQAKENMEEEKIYEASQFVKLALFLNPRSAEAHHMMGQIYLKNKAPRAKHIAEKELNEAVQLAPGEIEFILDLAEFYAENALYHRCRAYLDKAQAIELRHPRAIAIRKAIKGRID